MADSTPKTLLLSSRGTTSQERHFLKELKHLLPRSQQSGKIDRSKNPGIVSDLLTSTQCSSFIYFEKKAKLSYLWLGLYPGPGVKFLLQNLRTSEELKFDGNCSKACKYCLSFDSSFNESDLMKVLKEIITQVFSIENCKCPAGDTVDRVLAFTYAEGRIFFRNYSVTGNDLKGFDEIGPRFVLTPLKVMVDGMAGTQVFRNGKYGRRKEEGL